MQGRQSATLDSSRKGWVDVGVSRSSSSKPAQLPPLFEDKSNMIDIILTSKSNNRLDPSVETYTDLNKILAVEQDEKFLVRANKQQATEKLLAVVLVKCRRISQSLLGGKGKPDQILVKQLKCSSCLVPPPLTIEDRR